MNGRISEIGTVLVITACRFSLGQLGFELTFKNRVTAVVEKVGGSFAIFARSLVL